MSVAPITADHLDIESAKSEPSDSALDALAALLIDFALNNEPENP